MPFTLDRRRFKLWKSRSRRSKRRNTRRHLGQLLEPRIMLAADADLVVPTTSAPVSAVMGETIPVSWTVQNQGTEAGTQAWTDRIYLSTDDLFDEDDQLLDSRLARYQVPLAVGSQYTAHRNVAIPSTLEGDQFLLFVTDTNQNQEETNEENNTYASAINIAAPDVDLTTSLTSSPASAIAGDSISVSWTVTNEGGETTNARPWQDRVYLSSDAIFDDSDKHIGTAFTDDRLQLDGGESYTNSVQISDLRPELVGDQFLLVVTDQSGYQSENDETNNVAAAPINIAAPNLSISNVTAPSTAGAGEMITVSYQVTNNSAVSAPATWTDRLYFSTTEELDGARFLLQFSTNGLSPLGPGESYQVVQQFSIPTDLSGDGYLLIEANYSAAQLETDNTDNVGSSAISIPSPELEAVDLTVPPTAVAGDSIDVTWTVANNGPGTAVAAWNDSIYISTDDVWDDEDTILLNAGSSNFTPLPGGADYLRNNQVDLRSVQSGDHYLILYVDANNRHQESDETNNTVAMPISISAPNLVATDLTFPATVTAGERITAEWTVSNDSLLTVNGNWSESIYLSSDNVWDDDDLSLTGLGGNSLGAGESYAQSRDFQLRGESGEQFLLLVIDPYEQQGETNELDNLIAKPITVLAPNLTPTDFAAPAVAETGATIGLTWTVTNDSDQAASSQWYDNVYLSTDDQFDPADRRLAQINQGNQSPLAAGASYTYIADVALTSVPAGSWNLLLVTDALSGQSESDETDNVQAIPIEISLTNLVVSDVSAPAFAASGETITVNWTATNDGSERTGGFWNDYVYLSRDPLFDASDQGLVSQTAAALLGPGESYSTFSSNVRLNRIAAGDYYLLVVANKDGQLAETNDYDNVAATPITIGLPDVQPSALTAPASVVLGETVNLTWTVDNISDLVATGGSSGWRDEIYLSDDQTLDRNSDTRILTKTIRSETPVAAGESYTASNTVFFPPFETGNKFLIVNVDSSNTQLESDETNNQFVVPIELNAPDLIVSDSTSPASVSLGERFSLAWTVTNQGDHSALARGRDAVYVSADDTWDTSDRQLFSQSGSTMGAGDSYTRSRDITPSGIDPGEQFLLFFTDYRHNQGETDETNNVRAVPINFTAPDLIVSAASAPAVVNLGDSIDVTWTVENIGEVATVAHQSDGFYLSRDDRLDSSDTQLIGHSATALGPGESYMNTAPVSVGGHAVRSGDYFLLVQADGPSERQGETNEDNNVFAIPIEVRSPDLVVTNITAPETFKPGEEIEISWTVRNDGDGIASQQWIDWVAIARDDELNCPYECGDFDLDFVDAGDFVPLGPGESYTQTLSLVVPSSNDYGELLTPGRYYIGVRTDGAYYSNDQPESNENNNELLIPITVISPDVDLVVSELIVPESAELGTQIEITATITNLGTEPANGRNGRWSDDIRLSTDPIFDFSDSRLLIRTASDELPLAGGQSYTFTELVTIPDNAFGGSLHVVVKTDSNSQIETDETNNTASQPIEVSAPNLVFTSHSAPASASLSETVNVSWTVQNDSSTAARASSWSDRVYLSDDQTFSFNDRQLVSQTHFDGLAANGSYTFDRQVSFSNVTAGSKYLLFVTDANNNQGETNEDDNVVAVPIELAAADLVLTDFSGPEIAAVGDTLTVSRTVENQGVGPAPGLWSDSVWLSLDTTIDASDTRVGTASAGAFRPLGIGGSYTAPIDVTIPNVDPGNYFLLIDVDTFDAQTETNEANNTGQLAVTISAPDLALTDATVPTTGLSNDSIEVSYQVTNTSVTDAAADWQDRIYLSTSESPDDVITTLHIESIIDQSPLAGSANYTVTTDVDLPGVDPGDYFLLFETNTNSGQGELDRSNNLLARPIAIEAPNLTVTNATAPSDAGVNQTIDVSYRVLNDSTLVASGNWSDRIYLSDDEVLDSGDRFLGSVTINDQTPLAAGADYSIETTVTLPRDSTGEKFLLFQTNSSGSQGETDRGDNTASSAITIAPPPNLTIDDFQAPDTAAVGETIAVSYTVTNAGSTTAFGNWRDVVEIFADTDPGTFGQFLDDTNINDQTPLAPGASYTVELSVRLPQSIGDQFLRIRANNSGSQGESDYDDNHLFSPISIVAPDLVIDSFNAPSAGGLGEPVSISYVVTNQSDVPAVRDWRDLVYLSDDATLDGGDIPITGGLIDAPTTLLGGESYAVTRAVTMPRVAVGNWFLILQTDKNNTQTETNESNNVSTALPILLQASDLLVSDVVVPAEAISGQAFNVTWTVTNTGDTAASNWTDRVLVSTDQGIGGDLSLGDFPFNGVLLPGESVTRTQGATTPIEFNGARFVVITTDPEDVKPEVDELNNSAISTAAVQIQQAPIPNLVPSDVTSTATERQLFELFVVDWVVTNVGSGATNTPVWRDEVYLSIDTTFDGTDVLIGSSINPNFLNAGEAYAGSATVQARGVSEGDYYLIVRADGRDNLEEYSGDGDNITVGPQIRITLPPPPDLVVPSVIAPELAFSGQSMLLSWTVENQGDASARSRWDDAVYMSTDEVLDANDRLLRTVPHQTLYQIHRTVSYAGDYESCFGQARPDPVEDLRFQSPNSNIASDSYSALVTQDNRQTVCSIFNGFGEPTETVTRVTDYSFGSIERSLDVDETYSRSVNVQLPIGITGDFFFFVLADAFNTVNEFAFDDNNENYDVVATTVQLTPPPDLEVTDLAIPTTARAGDPFTLSYSAINAGATKVPNFSWRDSFYLSTDDQFDSETDILLGDRRINFPATQFNGYVGGLEADNLYSRDVSLTMPNGLSGDYFLIAVADRPDEVFELDNANNVLVSSTPISVALQAPDLVVTSVSADESVRSGQSLNVNWTVTNQGVGDTISGAWTDSIYASTDDQIGSDVLLGSFTHYGRLDPGQSYDRVGTVSVPLSLGGALNVYVQTDHYGGVAEFEGESNNASEFAPVNVIRETADLQVAPTEFAAENGRVRLGWQVENVGTNRSNSAYWRDAVYLSPNETFGDEDDIRLSSIYVSQTFEPGQSYSIDRLFDVPFHLNDSYNFFVVSDEQDVVDESGNESNNVALLGQLDASTLRTFPDLTVHSVDAPDEAISGQYFDVTWTVRNIGDPIAVGAFPPEHPRTNWTDAVYLSRDQVFDAGSDFYLGRAVVEKSQLVEVSDGENTVQEYSVAGAFRVPDGVTGPLYVIVLSDRQNQVIEIGAEDNNSDLDAGSMFVSLAEVADLAIGVVNVPDDTALGSIVDLSYTLENLGVNRVVGRWNDRLYLSTDDQFSLDDVSLGLASQLFNVIDPGASESFDFRSFLPAVLPGNYHVILRTDAFNAIPESDELNNLGASLQTFNINVPTIELVEGAGAAEIEETITSGRTRSFYYRFAAEAGQTIAIDGIGIDLEEETYINRLGNVVTDVRRDTQTAAYVSFERVPTPVDYDQAETALLSSTRNSYSGQRLVIPRTDAGFYYLRIDVTDRQFGIFSLDDLSREHMRVELNVLPFSIIAVGPAVVGNAGAATLDITASNLNVCSAAELLHNGEVVRTSDEIRVNDQTSGFVTFDFDGLDPDAYELRLTDHDGSFSTYEINVEDGVGARVDGSIRGPRTVRAAREYVFYANYGNNGDADGIAPLLLITNQDASPFSLSRDGLDTPNSSAGDVVQTLGISPDGEAGVLRPGQRNSVPVFFKTTTSNAGRFRLHTITAEDSRPIDIDLIMAQIRPSGLSDAEWAPIRDGLIDRIGPTWGDYVRTLAGVVTDLGDIGVRTNDINIVFDELVRQVSDPQQVQLIGHAVSGEVCISVSRPIVRAYGAQGSFVNAVTSESGMFSLVDVPDDTYQLVIDADGYARTTVDDVDVGLATTRIVVNMESESSIGGLVQLADGAPLNNRLFVSAIQQGSSGPESRFASASDGLDFLVNGLPAGEYQLTISSPGYAPQEQTVAIAAGEAIDLGAVILQPAASVSGTVLSNIAEINLQDVTVGAYQDDQLITSGPVAVDGSFTVGGLATGIYELRAVGPITASNALLGISSRETIDVEAGDQIENANLQLFAGATIRGTVRDSEDTPLGQVPVLVVGPNGDTAIDYTDSSGQYEVGRVDLGQYRVSVLAGSASTVQVDSIDGDVFQVDLAFASSMRIQGSVRDADGNALDGTAVVLQLDGQQLLSTLSDGEGHYAFLLTQPGTFELTATRDQATFPIATDLEVGDDETITHDFVAGSSILTINVVGGANNGQDDVVFLYRLVGGEEVIAGSELVGESGSVRFDRLVPGQYRARVLGSQNSVATVETALNEGEEQQIAATLAAADFIGVTVSDSSGNPISDAFVMLRGSSATQFLGPTNESGQVRSDRVASGDHTLIVIAPGFTATITDVQSNTSVDVTLQPSTSELTGTVLGVDGDPLLAHVEVLDAEGRIVGFAETASDGTYRITTALGAALQVVIRSGGHAPQILADVEVATDSVVALDPVMLQPVAVTQGVGSWDVTASQEGAAPPAGNLQSTLDAIAAAQSQLAILSTSQPESESPNPAAQSFFSIPGGQYVSLLFNKILEYQFGEGDFERTMSMEVLPTAVIPLPDGCTPCASLRNQANAAVEAQAVRAEIGEIIDSDINYQRNVVAGTFGLELVVVTTGVIGTVAAAVALAPYIATIGAGATVAPVSLGAATGTFATGAINISGLALTQMFLGIVSTIQGINSKTESLVNAASTNDAVQTADDIGGLINGLSGLLNTATGYLQNANYVPNGSVSSGLQSFTSVFGPVMSILGTLTAFYSGNPFQNTENQLEALSDLEASLINAKGNYIASIPIAQQKLEAYLDCVILDYECLDDDNGGGGNNNNNGNGNGNNSGNPNPNTPTPPTPPNPPNQFNPFLIQSQDPNDIIGPDGFGEEGWIGAGLTLPYMIRFENVAEATGAAQRVTIEQQLDDDLDPRTFRVDDFGWGDFRMELQGDQPFFQGRVELQDDSGSVVDVTATVDVVSGMLTWVFQTVDPTTGIAPEDALAGFLPPNVIKGEGEGFVTYTVRPRRNSPTGTRIDADATIVFDTNEPIDTPDIFNTLDAVSTTSRVADLPASNEEPQFLVSWSGEDDESGSALADFSVFVSIDDGPWQPWLVDTTLTEAAYEGAAGRSYSFATTSRDNAGNIEPQSAEPDAYTVVAGGELATIGDFIWSDDNNNGIQDVGEPGIAGVTVKLLDADGLTLQTTTSDADGLYNFDSLTPDVAYAFELVPQSGFAFVDANQGDDDSLDSDVDPLTSRTENFTAIPGDNLDWDAGLVPLGSIAGVIWDDQNGNTEREAGEPLLVGWTVYLDTNNSGEFDDDEPSRLTDEQGSYAFDELLPGSYTVAQMLQPGWIQTYPGALGANSISTRGSVSATAESTSISAAADLIELDRLRASEQFAHYTGLGYSVVIIDSGIDQDHPFFGADADGNGVADRIVYQYDFADDDSDASDRTGHGSHLASVIASEDSSHIGIVPDANIIALKVFGDDGRGYFADVEQALQWVVDNAAGYNIAAVNLSFGDGANWDHATSQYGLGDELAWLASRGVVTVTATGNNFGPLGSVQGVQYPAADPNTIAVGAVWDADRGDDWNYGSNTDHTTGADRVASFSQRHSELTDIMAPGALITGANAYGGQSQLRGTSQAASFVAGAAVLAQQIAQQHHGRALTTDEFRALLADSSVWISDGDDEDDSVRNTGARFARLDLHSMALRIAELDLSSSAGAAVQAVSGNAAIGPLNGQASAYTIDLAPGQDRNEVDFGNQIVQTGGPTVEATIQNGLSQRSYVDTLQFDFSEQMNLADLIADGSIVDAIRITDLGINVDNDADQSVPLTAAQFSYEFDEAAGISRLVWSLDEFADSESSLADGLYQIVLDAGLITDAAGNSLDGDGDGQGSSDYELRFHRLQGDADGSGLVDEADMNLVNAALGARPSVAHWNADADLDRDDRISVRDRVIVARADGNAIIDSPTAGSVFDANADGIVSARDALVIINRLGRQNASGEVSSLGSDVQVDRFDVNRDGRVSAVDALQVINRLAERTNLLQTSPEGEANAELHEQSVPVEQSIPQAVDSIAVKAVWQADSIDDDLLRLLADDQARTGIGANP